MLPFRRTYAAKERGWFVSPGFTPVLFKTALGGCFAFDLWKFGPRDVRFGVRQLGRGPPRHRLTSLKVRAH